MNELLKKIVEKLDKKLAEDIVVIDFEHRSSITDYFVIVTAKNYRHASSLCDEIYELLTNEGITDFRINDTRDSGWLVVDINDIVVHIFLKEDREKYQLEKLWADQSVLRM